MQMYLMPDGTEIPYSWVIAALVFPLVVMVSIAAFLLTPGLFAGMLGAMALIAAFIWTFSRGTDWLEPLELEDEDYL